MKLPGAQAAESRTAARPMPGKRKIMRKIRIGKKSMSRSKRRRGISSSNEQPATNHWPPPKRRAQEQRDPEHGDRAASVISVTSVVKIAPRIARVARIVGPLLQLTTNN